MPWSSFPVCLRFIWHRTKCCRAHPFWRYVWHKTNNTMRLNTCVDCGFPQCSNWLTNEYSRTYYMCTTVNSYQLSYYVTAYCISVDIWMSIAVPTLLMQYSDHNLLLNITGQYQSHLTISRKAKVEEKRKKRNGDKLKSNIEQNSVTLSQLLSV